MTKLILDLDTGVDDALAIAYALGSPEVELIGITGTYGNVLLEQGVRNALAITELLGHPEVKVYKGIPHSEATDGFEVLEISKFIHGNNGIGDVDIPDSTREAETEPAVDFIIDAVKTYGNTKYADYVESWNDEPYYEYDFEKAKELYAASGASNLNLKLMYVTSDETAMMATIIQAELAELGINVELCGYDSQLFNQYKYDGADQWDLMLDEVASSTNLANVYKLAWDSKGYTHDGALNYAVDDQLQSLLEAAMNEKTHNDETMNAFHQYLKEQCYGIGLVQKLSNVAHTDTIKTLETCFRGQVLPGACEY